MLRSSVQPEVSTRVRFRRVFVADGHSAEREALDILAAQIPDAYVAWEGNDIILVGGQRVRGRFILWVPQDRNQPPDDQELTPPAEAPASRRRSRRKHAPRSAPPPPAAATTEAADDTDESDDEAAGKYKSITRIDHPAKRTFGYFVRVTWKKQTRSKFFSDRKCGGRLAALHCAIEWRDVTEQELGKPRSERVVIGSARNSTGVVGVRRMVKEGSEVFEVTWRKPGNRVGRTSFSIAKHGEERAFELAARERRRREEERLDSPHDASL
jgi:hypothetical protein